MEEGCVWYMLQNPAESVAIWLLGKAEKRDENTVGYECHESATNVISFEAHMNEGLESAIPVGIGFKMTEKSASKDDHIRRWMRMRIDDCSRSFHESNTAE
jgi:ssRNA-specific RNase YbeY (16S rRNA maturation enzyme)